jgi:multiple sugar transport system permease protein
MTLTQVRTLSPDAATERPTLRRNGRSPLHRRRARLGMLLVLPAVVLLGFFFIWPLIRTFVISFQNYPLLGQPSFAGLANYTQAFTDPEFLQSVLFTFLYTVITTPVLLVVGLLLASLVRRGTRAARIFQTIYFLPVVIGLASASYLWLFLWQPDIGPVPDLLSHLGVGDPSTNLFASFWSAFLIVVGTVTWKIAGLQMLLLLSGMQSIPTEVNEAARIDGSSRWQLFRYITVPLLRPTLALVLVFSVAGSLLAFDQFYIMTAGGPDNGTITAVYQIYRVSFNQFQLGYGAALSILLMIVLGLVSAFQMLLLRNSDNA